MSKCFLLATVFLFSSFPIAAAREWKDATGKYSFVGDAVAHNADTVMIKSKDGKLVATEIAALSKADQQYLAEREAATSGSAADQMHTWTFVRGAKAVGRVVAYGRKDLTIQRRRGKIYANDRVYDNLPETYQKMLLRIVSHETGETIEDKKALEKWILKLKGAPAVYKLEGVILELENGDEYGVPFFFFSKEDLAVLQPGWERWSKADADEKQKQQENLYLQSVAQEHQRDRQAKAQVTRMQLGLLGVNAGVFDLWEVALYPNDANGIPMTVIAPGRNSAAASAAAMNKYPGYTAGAVAKVSQPRY